MNTVLLCLTTQHHWVMVALAATVCLGGLMTAMSLYERARRSRGQTRLAFGAGAVVTGGLAVWTTHFTSMLGYDPGIPLAYDMGLTFASLALALGAASGTALIALAGKSTLAARILAGLFGICGVAAMHFVGMSALRMPGTLSWDPALVATALLTSMVFATLAGWLHSRGGWKFTLGAAFTGTLAVSALHFIAMGASTITPDPSLAVEGTAYYGIEVLGVIAAAIGVLVVAAAASTGLTYWSRTSALRQLREAIDAMPDGLGFYDSQDRLVLWNARYAEVNPELCSKLERGMTFRQILEIGISEGLYQEAIGREEEWIASRIEARKSLSNTLEQPIAGNRWLRVQDRMTAAGGIVTAVNDITELKRDAQALAEARDAAEAANAAKSQFLANMSHEIRTPLNGVIGVAQALSHTDLSEEQRNMLKLIDASGRTLQILLSDILDLARVESGRLQLTPEPMDLHQAVEEAAQLYAESAREKGLQYMVEIAEDCPRWIEGDVVRLKQILTNLVSNAVKFTADGMVQLTIGAGVEASGRETLRLAVSDTGIGFDAATRDRLFSRFEQADGGITRQFGGSGLGLAICRQLAEMMGGTLDCESEPGGGACFMLSVPLKRVAAPVDEAPAAPMAESREGLNILVADDHPTNRKVVELILSQVGARMVLVENGQQAVDAYREDRFDIVLMDMQMPVMDGLTATREIRSIEASDGRERTPVVMLTANALAEHVAAAQAAGADRHLAKPFDAAELIETVTQLPEQARQAA
ncbi:ATP-binding protein [Brevundimonas poindexterae]|uniref:ATP-binding protein n=1 Tax=Brevundimonas poindexterae TaxID=74325 RepID=UPI001CFEC82B|nr:ATP-binding protein [Brevundimonas poindexterae]